MGKGSGGKESLGEKNSGAREQRRGAGKRIDCSARQV